MPRIDSEVRITPSVLDRLIDYEPEVSREPPASRPKSLRQLKQAVRRDLEWLLNSRKLVDEIPEDLERTSRSVAAYGLPDFTGVNASHTADQNYMRRIILDSIRKFEPRLSNVTVTLEPSLQAERAIRFRIDALLRVDPAPEPVTFDTTLHMYNGEYTVQGVL